MARKKSKRGFTLVELMIVVAIIGVLAALAIYGVRRYLASSKTSEAKNTVGAITRGAAGAYERESTAPELVVEGQESAAYSHSLCGSTAAVPATPPPGKKYQPDSTIDYELIDTQNGWKCLKFNLTQAHYYSYKYTKDGMNGTPNPPAGGCATNCFEVQAKGDIDADLTAYSYFANYGRINTATKALQVATQLHIVNEFE